MKDFKLFALSGLLVALNAIKSVQQHVIKEAIPSFKLYMQISLFVIIEALSWVGSSIYAEALIVGIALVDAYIAVLLWVALVIRCFIAFGRGLLIGLHADYRISLQSKGC